MAQASPDGDGDPLRGHVLSRDPGSGPDPARDGDPAAGFDESPVDPADIASAGRSCSAIVVLLVVLALLVCVGVAARWFVLQ